MTMRIAITGASGLIGTALTEHLRDDGHDVLRLVRDRARTTARAIYWSVEDDVVDTAGLEGVDAVVHLAGEPIGAHRWNDEVKRRIRSSRTRGTDLIARAVASLSDGPEVLISASAIGWYGDRGDEVLTEESSPGFGFLAEVVEAWELAAQPARDAGIRVVHPRTGIVLDEDGGALNRMLPFFRVGAGGRIGTGEQWMSWISVKDEVRALRHLLTSSLSGPVNLVAAEPVQNAEFTEVLGEVLHRPIIAPFIPVLGVRALYGEMGVRLTTDSQRVIPQRLLDDGFQWEHPELGQALRWALDG